MFQGLLLTRDIPSLIGDAGFGIKHVERLYLSRFPKSWTHCCWGTAGRDRRTVTAGVTPLGYRCRSTTSSGCSSCSFPQRIALVLTKPSKGPAQGSAHHVFVGQLSRPMPSHGARQVIKRPRSGFPPRVGLRSLLVSRSHLTAGAVRTMSAAND